MPVVDPRRYGMEPVVACSLTAADQSVRRQRWLDLGAQSGVVVRPTERGLELAFGAANGVEDELRELAELERVCCAFADWEVWTDPGRVVLDVSGKGPEGVAAVQAMFGALRTT
jgi:hypothetical protein